MAYNIVKFVPVLAVFFMAAPLYNHIVVHERRRLGKAPFLIDRYAKIFHFTFFIKKVLDNSKHFKYISINL